jgi:hypothetical protein
MKAKSYFLVLFFMGLSGILCSQIPYPGVEPSEANVKSPDPKTIILENRVLRMQLSLADGKIKVKAFEDLISGENLIKEPVPIFELKLKDGEVITSDNFKIKGKPSLSEIVSDASSAVFAERIGGKKYSADLQDKKSGIDLHWETELRNGSNYIRQIFRFRAIDENRITRITLVSIPSVTGVHKAGNVDGSPLVTDKMFVALEYPLARIESDNHLIRISVPGLTKSLSTVWGITPEGQQRRGFLYYVERERAHPYHQVLHYNSWFDISWHNRKFTEQESIDRIRVFGDSLIRARNVNMTGFLFDDGWDDNRTLWKFHSGFPEGFSNLKTVAKSYSSNVGVWMSPFGGYGEPKESRIEFGNKQNPPFETNANGFSLSGPVYYNRFMDVTSDFIKKYDICMFKFDGVGAGIGAGSGDLAIYQKDVKSFLGLLGDLLNLKPNLYLSLTTGTWPSVYWLMHGDNIWRGGDDTNMMGEGSKRQQWITYRDADTYKNIVLKGPLFPLNSLMLCGICIADNGNPGIYEMNDKDISDEIWSFFATGTNLQELYINPHKLNSSNWDCLASAASWAKENESVLTDVHWVGGDPGKGEVYGYAAWSEMKSVISLRNPSSIDKIFYFSVKDVFEIPPGMNDTYSFTDAISKAGGKIKPSVDGRSFMIILKPFEVRIFNAVPIK